MQATGKLQQETFDPDHDAAAFALHEARQRGMQRTVQALFRERLLAAEHLIVEGAVAWLPLWALQSLLRFDGLQIGRSGDCRLAGPVSFYRSGERPQPVATPATLLAHVARSLQAPPDALARLQAELDNSLANDALCLNFRRSWAQRLRTRHANRSGNFIAALRAGGDPNATLLLEQWGALGHPWHPMHKTKLGLSAGEVTALSPEFEARIDVALGAIRADVAHVEAATARLDYPRWFAAAFPSLWQQWTQALRRQGRDVDEWLPLPLHPFQAQQVVPELFADELRSGELLLTGLTFSAAPTMSFRTVVPQADAALPHIKLPVSLRLTSVQRTVSPKSAVMGPRVTRLLRHIVADEHGFYGTLAIAGEEFGLHYLDPHGNDDVARQLSVLYRSNPAAQCAAARLPVPVGALFADSPFDGRPLALDLVGAGYGGDAEAFYRTYCAVALNAVLGPYLLYGIAFEAHQQNSFVIVDENLQPVQLLLRDFGDLRIHAPSLRARGHVLEAYRAGHTLFEDTEPPRDKILHAFMLCHLAELGLLLARTHCQPEGAYWSILRQETERVFDALRPRADAARWQAERHALLEADWPAKSFLRMRLADRSDDWIERMPNPLKARG